MKILHKNVYWLALAQACFLGASMTVVSYSGLVGKIIAPSEALATFPIGFAVVTTAMTTGLFSKLMARKSRKFGFFLGSSLGVSGALIASFGVYLANFWLFCFGLILTGLFLASVQYYRFAAIESVAPEDDARAVSTILLGGLLGALVVPYITGLFMDAFAPDIYIGAYLFAASSILLGIIPLTRFKPLVVPHDSEEVDSDTEARSLKDIIKQPVYIAAVMNAATGYAMMSFIMTASPLAMEQHGMGPDVSRYVIQMHVFAMFAPSLVTGSLINRFGVTKVLLAGHAFFIMAFIAALSGLQLGHFSVSLIALGVGWNFCFVGGTTMLQRGYRKSEKAKAQGLNETMVFSAQATAVMASGYLLHLFGWARLNQVAIALLMVTIFATMRYALSKDRLTDH